MATKTVNLVGEVNDEMYSKLLEAMVEAQESEDSLKLIINTQGGDEFTAIAMFDLIKQTDARVTGMVVGTCHSAGILVFLACDDRYCTENAEFLFHLGSGSYDNPEELKRLLRADRLWNALVAESTGQPLKTVVQWHRQETYMDAKSAVKNGLAKSTISRGNK